MSMKIVILLGIMVVLPLATTAQEAPSIAGTLALGEPVVGELAGDEAQSWAFSAQAGERVHISAERYPPNPDTLLDPALTVTGPDGTLIAEDDDSGVWADALLLDLTLPQDGLYNVTVRNVYAWEGGSYQLTVAPSMYPQNCSTPRGDVLVGQMPSDIIGGTLRYRILLPPCHAEIGRQWPYALLMHGSNSSDEHWQQLGADEALTRGVALGRLPYMALALPFGGQLANTNTFREGGSYEYVLVDEFMPFIEGNHCLQAERTGRGIGGISRGGFWAFLVAFRHPELFSALGGHSPFFDLYHAPASHNPLALALATPPSPALRVWMDRGQNDYAQLNIDLQHERLTQNGIVHTFQLNPVGQHNNAYWSAHLDDYLAFYSAEWPLDPADLPACAVPAPEDVP